MMKKFLLVLCSAVTLCPSYAQLLRRALFLGNSYTYYHNMPQIAASIAQNRGDTLVFDSNAPGGYTLDDHSIDPVSLSKIAAGNWDYLILQEQSQLPSFPTYFSNGLSGMCASFRNSNPCGRIMFYMTWGRMNGDAGNCPVWPPVCTYSGMDSLLRLRYVQTAMNSKAELSAVGAAWRYVRNHYPSINLYDTDGSHPSPEGSYLAACCFYTALFKKDPSLVTYNYTLSAIQAAQLRQAVKAVIFDSLSYWTYAPTVPSVSFICTTGAGTNQVNCINTSTDADSYLWDFGDGTTSTLKNPSHNYAANGTYTITLTGYNCDLNTTYQASYQANVSFCPFTPTITPANLTLCPGISDTLWTQSYTSYQWHLFDGTPIPNATNQYLVCNTNDYYYVSATQNGCTEASVPVIVSSYNNLVIWYIAASGNLAPDTACIGDTVVLYTSFNKPPFPSDSLIDWSVNGQPLTGYHNDSLLITSGGTYTATVRHPACPSLNVSQQISFVFINCTTGIATPSLQPRLSVAPNPSSGLFHIRSEEDMIIQVYDMLGKEVLKRSLKKGDNSISLENNTAGVYYLEATGKERKTIVKLLKQ